MLSKISNEIDDDFIDIDEFIQSSPKLKKILDSLTPGENAKIYRLRDSLSRKQLSKLVGVLSEQTIKNFELGKITIGKQDSIKLAEIFGCSYKVFLAP